MYCLQCSPSLALNAWLPKSGVIVNADAWAGLDDATQAAVTEAAAAAEARVWDEMENQNAGNS